MIITQPRKNRISLDDYNYQRDIQHRLFLSDLSVIETQILHEIIDGSLTINLNLFADEMEIDEAELTPILDKFVEIHLIQRQDNMIFVDKELRKYFETHIVKFEEDFKPSIEFLQGLLGKVPLHVLPTWYSLPKTSDHIFQSIIEKYLITPRIYTAYLKQLVFDDPILNDIFLDMYTTHDFCLKSKDLMKKYSLTKEQLAEFTLLLEYHLVCCTTYRKKGNQWEEFLTPYAEWHDFLLFQRDTAPSPISETIKVYHPEEFGFTNDMCLLLKALKKRSLAVEEENQEYGLTEKDARAIFPRYNEINTPKRYVKNVIGRLLQLKLAHIEGSKLSFHHKAEEWLEKTAEEQAMILYRHPGCSFRQLDRLAISFTERDLREIERNLRRILASGWVYLDDFIKGFTSPIGDTEEITLKHKGKRWAYMHPTYTEKEEQIIKQTLCGRLFECGMVMIGIHKEKLCLRVTPFGQETFGEF